jgi:hypothetical protein
VLLRKKLALMLGTATMALTTLLLAVGTASADPPETNKNALIFTVVCGEDEEEVTFVTIGHSASAVANVVGSTSNAVLTELTFTFIDPDTDAILSQETVGVGQGNRTGQQDDLITCTAPEETLVDPQTGEPVIFVLSAEVFFTPRGS